MNQERLSKETAESWQDFLNLYHKYWVTDRSDTIRWIFRGESKAQRPLRSTLEREAERTHLAPCDIPQVEEQIITEFQRKAHHYLVQIPHIGDLSEWFSLMRHYGAPSRLLDWSYSPFIAAFFAVRGAEFDSEKPEDPVECVVYALDSSEYTGLKQIARLGEEAVINHFHNADLRQGFEPKLTKRAQAACLQYFLEKPCPDLLLVNPFRASDRATIQQGVHLMPCDITIPFEDNFAQREFDDKLCSVTIRLTKETRNEFLLHFHRLNLNEATLFPGLQGFAESLSTRMANPQTLSWGSNQVRLTTRWSPST